MALRQSEINNIKGIHIAIYSYIIEILQQFILKYTDVNINLNTFSESFQSQFLEFTP